MLPAPAALQAQTGLLIVAHGGGGTWNAGVRAVVEQVRWTQGPVATAFLMGPEARSSGWNAAVDRLIRAGAREIVVVPLLVSSYGAHYHQIRYYAGQLAELPPELGAHAHDQVRKPPVPMRVAQALDGAPELGQALATRWRALSDTERRRPVMLVAHGPSGDSGAALWVRNLDSATVSIRDEGRIPVAIGLLRDDAPGPVRAAAVAAIRAEVARLAAESGDSVTVLPVLISMGEINQVKIPRDLGGLPISYIPSALAPLPALARWVERVAAERLPAPR